MQKVDEFIPVVSLNEQQKAFNLCAQSAARRTHYTSGNYERYFDGTTLLLEHPFDPADGETVDYIGTHGHTASVGAFYYTILTLAGQPVRFRVWKCPQFIERNADPIGNDIFVEAVTDLGGGSYMVGGMTDFSGEGGAGYRDTMLFIRYMAQLFNVPIEVWQLTDLEGERGEEMITKAINEQYVEQEEVWS